MAEDPKPSEDVISLEDLVREAATPDAGDKGASQSVPPAANAGGDSSPDIDAVLAAEDPNFAESMKALRAEGNAEGAADIESLDLDGLEALPPTGWKAVFYWIRHPIKGLKALAARLSGLGERLKGLTLPRLKEAGAAATQGAKSAALSSVASAKQGFKSFLALPPKSKLLVGSVIALAILAFFVTKAVMSGRYLPSLEAKFIRSMEEIADAKFTYGEDEKMEEFTDPLHHPEHVVTLEKLVVNLRPGADGTNPMGVFEFFVEMSTHEGAVELKDREVEIRDTVSRTIEQMRYEELTTPDGKNKLKIVLRKNLNDFLSKGRVRRVFLKTIILKP